MTGMRDFDVIVIGGGHAGCEAAAAAARTGARVALITMRPDDLGTMSCNPAIGGLGKGHLVREIDALDGLMGRVADASAIQFRLLNRRKGPAVRGPRVQCDRRHYRTNMAAAVAAQAGITLVVAMAGSLMRDGRTVTGVATSVGDLTARAVVVTTGTFLNGQMHRGTRSEAGGRLGGASAVGLAASLRELGLPMARLKTGTPPRLDGRTIEWSQLEIQVGDAAPVPMASLTSGPVLPQLPCGVTRTTLATHAVVRAHLHEAAVYNGQIVGAGPRYCPSIEDKVQRFGDRDGHQIFLEPEGLDVPDIYPNGISTSLPADVQAKLVATIPGLEKAVILRPGYAIEYDHVDPRVLSPGLAVKDYNGLFLAGQINGTTGYEEAAAQGLVAGVNAARCAAGRAEAVFDRASSYLGVMIDDLVTQGVSEPYRMFTSRAEYRLRLRIDNVDLRLTDRGDALGLVGPVRRAAYAARAASLDLIRGTLDRLRATPSQLASAGIAVRQDGVERSGFEWLRFPGFDWAAAVRVWPELAQAHPGDAETVATDAAYSAYLTRQDDDVARLRRDEAVGLDPRLDYDTVAGLSFEMRDRLRSARPVSLGAAARVPGVTPAALTALLAHRARAA